MPLRSRIRRAPQHFRCKPHIYLILSSSLFLLKLWKDNNSSNNNPVLLEVLLLEGINQLTKEEAAMEVAVVILEALEEAAVDIIQDRTIPDKLEAVVAISKTMEAVDLILRQLFAKTSLMVRLFFNSI